MNILFESVETKLNRITVQISDLQLAMSKYSNSNSINLKYVINDDNLGFKIIVDTITHNIPTNEWNAMFLECVHNLRAVLDNFAFALARLKQDPPTNPKRIQFPIFTDKNEYLNKGTKYINQISNVFANQIEKLQPYNRTGTKIFETPQTDPLVIISELDNEDKHQIPSIALFIPENISFDCTIEFESEEETSKNVPSELNNFMSIGPIQEGQILYDYKTASPITKVNGMYYIRPEYGINFKGNNLFILPLLKGAYIYIKTIISSFNII